MFAAIAAFEAKYHLKAPLFYILLSIFFLLTFGATTSDAVTMGGAVGNVNRNAPYVIMQFLLIMSIFGILTTTAFVANSIHRDFELGTDALFFSAPIKKWQFLAGRFFGSFSVAVLVYLGVVGAIVIGSLMPWLEKERLGPFELWPYIYSLFVMVVPNLLLAGAIFFSIAALTRSIMATYASVIGFFVATGVAGELIGDIANETVAGLLDPFGMGAFFLGTRYWTVFQKNTQVLPLEGIYLWNRVLWVGISLLILAFAFWRFQFTTGTRKSRKKAKRGAAAAEELKPIQRVSLTLPKVTQTFGRASAWRQYFASIRLETAAIFKSIPFIIILLIGILNIWGNSTAADSTFGTPVYMTTNFMVETIFGAFAVVAMIIAAFYAGDIVWRERNLKMNEVTDTMPLPTWAQWAAKFSALLLVMCATLLAAILTAIFLQAVNGYYNFELALYVKGVFLQIGSLVLLITALAFIMQVLFNHKYVGFVGVMLWFVLSRAMPALDFEHRLYRFASAPPATYSDMNGYGHFAWPLTIYNTYWVLFVAAMLVVCHLLWVRGTEGALRQRLQVARQRFGKPVAATLVLFLIAFAGTGCYIYYNTNVLNRYRTSKDVEKLQADAEKKYKKFENMAKPRITAVKADVQIFPERRAVDIRGEYTMVNKTGQPLRELHVSVSPQSLSRWQFDIPGTRVKSDDRTFGYTIYTFDQPLAPGATLPLRFHVGYEAKGFENGAPNNNIVENGTFFNSGAYFPHLGYNNGTELQDRNKRRKYGLGELERLAPQTDMRARMDNGLNNESDWISLDTTVSTSPDQIALAPGYLQREWTQNGRRYFHYKTTSPILAFWSYLSARYEVKRDQWRDIPIEIYYDPKHPYNVDRMIDGVKKSLDYFTANFSPYQHKQVRILEFPRYARFAQSFPNTIPFSEAIGFVADLRDKEHIDYVFYVTAHEVAHQWWAHQVIGGNVKGSTMIVETMAQYSALMVMEKEYGRAKMQKFLRYELDRYLRDRGGELIAEMPLSQVENQGYIHYRKGSLVMYALRDYIGEERVNRALAKFIKAHAFSQPPYTTAGELVRYFRAEAPPEYQDVITDLFERIILFDNSAKEVSMTKRADGKYVVKMTVASTKLQADARGEEKPIPVNDWIDIGVLGEKDTVLFTEKRRITKPVETFEVVVTGKPVKAGIDPLNKLIDRNPKDNVKSL
ncbi:MAG TPA: M1 family aminopeptidase [Thermoanaerobaculia bacterium]|jgi:ABC-type transport system involved in multi-copper enzyme maturation permease subunit